MTGARNQRALPRVHVHGGTFDFDFSEVSGDEWEMASMASASICYDWQPRGENVPMSDVGNMQDFCGEVSPVSPATYADSSVSDGALTTVMLRNIPNRYSQSMLVAALNHGGFRGAYDFLYAPIDFQNRGNMGYAFINFVSEERARAFTTAFQGYRLPSCHSSKVCTVSWARHQGLGANIEHLVNSPVNDMPAEFKPFLFNVNTGEQVAFPQPDRQHALLRPRKHRGEAHRHATRTNKVFLGGLGPDTEVADLQDFCGQFGEVLDVVIVMDHDTGAPRGFGFCTFRTEAAAAACMASPMNSRFIHGRNVSIKPYTSTK